MPILKTSAIMLKWKCKTNQMGPCRHRVLLDWYITPYFNIFLYYDGASMKVGQSVGKRKTVSNVLGLDSQSYSIGETY